MERGTVLVVDDEANIADLIELYLAREGISFAMLKKIPKVTDGLDDDSPRPAAPKPASPVRARRPAPRIGSRATERVG